MTGLWKERENLKVTQQTGMRFLQYNYNIIRVETIALKNHK